MFKKSLPLLYALWGAFFVLSPYQAKAYTSCSHALYIASEYRLLTQIADDNKTRRESLRQLKGEKKEAETKKYLFHAIRYEEKKARIYIAMLEKILRRDDALAFSKTAAEIKRRLLRSLGAYENFSLALSEFEDFKATPISAPMSALVARYVESDAP